MGNDLHARAHTLARVRRGRMDVSDRWDSSGRTARDNYLTCSPAAAALLIPRQFRFTLRTRDERQRDELAPRFDLLQVHNLLSWEEHLRALLRKIERHPLPGWAAEIGCASWAQIILKFIVSHPAVTCAIPATTRVDHVGKPGRGHRAPAGQGHAYSHDRSCREALMSEWWT